MCDSCDWESLLEEIDEALEDEDFAFAEDTLQGIREWVYENEHCTGRQRDAVENILFSKE
jgi:hypothetical protein